MDAKQEVKNDKTCENKSDLIYKYSEKQTEQLEHFIVIPPDGGWGWIVVTAAFLSFFIADGIIYTFGIFLTDMSKSFGCSTSQVALSGAIMTGFFCLSGPFISALVNRFGYRKVSIAGSLIASSSCALTSVTSSLHVAFITHGVMGGFGFGMIYVPAVIAVGFYFEKWRALATGIAVCGAGIGGITLPPVLTLILNKIGWRHTFRLMSGLSFCCALCGLLYKPLVSIRITSVTSPKEDDSEYKRIAENNKQSFFIKFHNTSYPTIADIHKSQTVSVDRLNKSFPVSKSESEYTSTVTIFKDQKLATKISSEFLMSIPSDYSTSSKSSTKSIKVDKPEPSTRNIDSRLSTVFEEKDFNDKNITERWFCTQEKSIIKRKCTLCKERICNFLQCNNEDGNFRNMDIISRPLYRDDIFYSASLVFLPELKKSVHSQNKKSNASSATATKSLTALEYSMLMTRAVTKNELNEKGKCIICTESIKRTLATMLDFNLLRSPSFILLCSNALFTSFGFYTPYMFIKERAVQYGVPENNAFWLISCIGLTNTLGRIGCGVVTSFTEMRAITITYVSLLLGGIATVVSCLFHNIWLQFAYAALYGISVACSSALRTIIIVDMLGIEKLTNAMGIVLMFQGVATLVGTSISGFLRDYTGDYDASFYLAGGCICIGSLFLIPINVVSKWEKQYKER